MLEWLGWLIVLELIWWVFIGFVGREVLSLWRMIRQIPIEYN